MRAHEQNRWSNWILLGLVLLAVLIFSPMFSGALGGGMGLALGAIYLLAYLFAIIALPLMFFALMRFAYTVFARPYVRLWHIRRIRNARYLKETLKRG
jgi:membrane protein implicated in regulation of membrane protease activity